MIRVVEANAASFHPMETRPPLKRMIQIALKCEELKRETFHISTIVEFRCMVTHELIDFGKLLTSLTLFKDSSPERKNLEREISFRHPTLMGACKLMNESEGNGQRMNIHFGGLPPSPHNGWLVHELMQIHGGKHPALQEQEKRKVLAPKPKHPPHLQIWTPSQIIDEKSLSVWEAFLEAVAHR